CRPELLRKAVPCRPWLCTASHRDQKTGPKCILFWDQRIRTFRRKQKPCKPCRPGKCRHKACLSNQTRWLVPKGPWSRTPPKAWLQKQTEILFPPNRLPHTTCPWSRSARTRDKKRRHPPAK